MRGDERRNTPAYCRGSSLGAFRTALVHGVDEEGSVFWRWCARLLGVGSAARWLDGPSAHWPSGRGPGSEYAPKRAIGPRNRASGAIPRQGWCKLQLFFCRWKFPHKKMYYEKKTFLVRGCTPLVTGILAGLRLAARRPSPLWIAGSSSKEGGALYKFEAPVVEITMPLCS